MTVRINSGHISYLTARVDIDVSKLQQILQKKRQRTIISKQHGEHEAQLFDPTFIKDILGQKKSKKALRTNTE